MDNHRLLSSDYGTNPTHTFQQLMHSNIEHIHKYSRVGENDKLSSEVTGKSEALVVLMRHSWM